MASCVSVVVLFKDTHVGLFTTAGHEMRVPRAEREAGGDTPKALAADLGYRTFCGILGDPADMARRFAARVVVPLAGYVYVARLGDDDVAAALPRVYSSVSAFCGRRQLYRCFDWVSIADLRALMLSRSNLPRAAVVQRGLGKKMLYMRLEPHTNEVLKHVFRWLQSSAAEAPPAPAPAAGGGTASASPLVRRSKRRRLA